MTLCITVLCDVWLGWVKYCLTELSIYARVCVICHTWAFMYVVLIIPPHTLLHVKPCTSSWKDADCSLVDNLIAKKLILPTFRPDAPVLLRARVKLSRGTSRFIGFGGRVLIGVYVARVLAWAPRAFRWACMVCMLAPPLKARRVWSALHLRPGVSI